jgi:MFS transporter, DHA2 family, methylenomycin A resistance protein
MHDPSKQVQPPVAPKRSVGGNIGLTILATSLGFVLVQLDVSIVNIALAKIGADLGTAVAGLQWIVDSYALAFAALLLSAGALGDQIGARKGFIIGFAAFVAASIGCGLAPGPIALIVARAFQGIGAALLVPCSLALLNQAAGNDTRLRARAVSLWTASGSVALAVGPVLGGFLVDSLGWRSIFLINIPIGLAGIFLTQAFVQESPSRHHTFDPAGQLFAITALLGLVGAVICSEGSGFSPIVWCSLIIAFVSTAAFVSVESRVSSPMLPLDFFRQPTFTAATLIGLAVPCMTTALLTTVPASRSGVASGVLNSVRQAGGALGVAVYGALLNEKNVAGAQLAFWISAVLLILAALVAAIGVKHMTVLPSLAPNSPEARSA